MTRRKRIRIFNLFDLAKIEEQEDRKPGHPLLGTPTARLTHERRGRKYDHYAFRVRLFNGGWPETWKLGDTYGGALPVFHSKDGTVTVHLRRIRK